MIATIRGNLLLKSPNSIIVDVGGVGYQIFIPLSTFYRLPDKGEKIVINTYTHMTDDSIRLYGFLESEEKDIFLSLIGVSGIGPKLALCILSGIPPDDLVSAIKNRDITRLHSIPGIGRKTAERLVLELRDKLIKRGTRNEERETRAGDSHYDDALSALINLGYRKDSAEKALRTALSQLNNASSVEEVIKESLKVLLKVK